MSGPKKRFISIKTKLIAIYMSVVILSMLIFSIVIFWQSEKVVIHLAQQNVTQTMLASYQSLTTKIDNINISMLSFQIRKDVQEILCNGSPDTAIEEIAELEQILMEIDTFQNSVSKLELYVLDRDDYPPLSRNNTVFSARQMENDIWFNNALSSGSGTTWTLRNHVAEGNGTVAASKVLTDVTTNRPIAVLKADINLQEFSKSLDNIVLAETGQMFLSSQSHLVSNDNSPLGQMLINHPVLFNDMLTRPQNEMRTAVLNGDKWLLSSYPLKDTGLYLVGAVKLSEFSATQGTIAAAILITALVLAIFSLLLIWVISGMISKPAATLAASMRNYEIGNTIPLEHNTRDEFGILFDMFNCMQSTIAKLIADADREAAMRKRAELKALQAQITPHFLYNTLNSIRVLSKKYGATDVQEMIMALSKFFRISLNNGAEMLTLRQELEQVKAYMYLQKVRYRDSFDITITLPDELSQYSICKLTLQPLVENCINHAFPELDEPGHIELVVQKQGDYIIITISDNGLSGAANIEELNRQVQKAFDPEEPIEKYGIHNVNQRIHLYFGDECGLSYKPNYPSGLTAVVKIRAIELSPDKTIQERKNNRND